MSVVLLGLEIFSKGSMVTRRFFYDPTMTAPPVFAKQLFLTFVADPEKLAKPLSQACIQQI